MGVRSLEFFHRLHTGSTAPLGPTTEYTVPSGHTAILKQLVVSTFGAGTPAVILYAGHPSSLQPVFLRLALGAAVAEIVDIWMVLEPGFVIQSFVDNVNSADITWMSASGAELIGVA